ncbi:HlyD family efflux transporter periplasmic adaptor subunit [Joostella atrarenae]|uniref:HlyD family efflux transporter periplasmic adaptor subunit n=1 Tax=Joostella atrarenae TaxID=679257 RepID=A0ABS9J7M8_9FLAO|nr:HlyD family efflux transporter periplasmic adaptor subunit [Joostella atrarenae]MCF8716353.1 HlyD family efflux transporter periplasmic adaptor subunit [Joostella atrarenae]
MKTSRKKIEGQDYLYSESSEGFKDILGKSPSWMIIYGTTIVFVIVLLLIIGAALISYNDIISAKIVITSKNPPIYLKARSAGRLQNIFVEANQYVKKGEILAVIENTADIEDIKYLKSKIKIFYPRLTDLDSLRSNFSSNLNLGNIQSSYNDFISKYQKYILYNSLLPNQNESEIIRTQLNEQIKLLQKQQAQLKIMKQDIELANDNYHRHLQLFEKGVISEAEYQNIYREFLTDQQTYEGFMTNISNTRITISNYHNLLNQSNIEDKSIKNNYKQELEQSYQTLKNKILDWEYDFLVKSPIPGKVTVFDIWNRYQSVDLNTTLFTIVPQNYEEIIGRVKLPIHNSGKVKLGQKVIIKLDNYPFAEWGSIEGEIASISEVPLQGEKAFYTLYIELKGLQTSHGKSIDFRQEMQGKAEIVIEELSILQRIFYHFRNVLSRT